MSGRKTSLSLLVASIATIAACSAGGTPTSPDLSPAASGSSSSTGGGTATGGGTTSTIPTIVARVDSTSTVNNGTSYYPSWETIWYIGGHSLYAFVPTARKSSATRIHSATGALVAGDCVTATYVVSGSREYAQDLKLEAPEVCQ